MPESYEIKYNMLSNECKPSFFNFKDTSQIESLEGIIGQDRAVKAMQFGLNVKVRGYNIYMSGMSGTGKTSYAQKYIRRLQ